MPNFAFYSGEVAYPTTDPSSLDPAPAILVLFDQDPIMGEYDSQAGSLGRGAVIPTLGGAVYQDLGVYNKDQKIRMADTDAFGQSTITSIDALFRSTGEYYFTDGYEIWQVRFSRPNGFKYWRNLKMAHFGKDIFSYEINLDVTWKSGEA